MKTYSVSVIWDPESEVYIASSDDIPGLVTEASSLRGLIKKLKILIPELTDLNRHLIDVPSHQDFSIDTISISANFQIFEEELRVT